MDILKEAKKAEYLFGGQSVMKSIKREPEGDHEHYLMDVHPVGHPEVVVNLDVNCVCPGLEDLAQKIENGETINEDVLVEVCGYGLNYKNLNKGHAHFASKI